MNRLPGNVSVVTDNQRSPDMKHLFIAASCAAAACGIAVPAFAGLSGNSSFSHSVPVRVPSQASVVKFDDRGRHVEPGDDRGKPTSTSTPTQRHSEPGDDRGTREPEPGDDRGSDSATTPDDNHPSTEPGDDHGTGTEPGDDSGGHGGSGSGSSSSSGSGSSGSGDSGSGDSGHGGGGHDG